MLRQIRLEWLSIFATRKVVLFFVSNILFIAAWTSISVCSRSDNSISLMHCLFYLLYGEREYLYGQTDGYTLPVLYIMFQIALFIMTMGGGITDVASTFNSSLLNSGTRRRWVTSKILWLFSTVLFYYLSEIIIIYILINASNHTLVIESTDFNLITKNIAGILVILIFPLISDLCIALIQFTLQFFLNPVIALGIIVGYLVLGAYWKKPFLLGNYCMLIRNKLFSPDGLSWQTGAITIILTGIATIILSLIMANRKDFLGNH